MKRTLIYSILISLILITPFIYSDDLYNGLISAKQIWFYVVMALLILAFGIDLLFCRKNVSYSLNIIDISLLAFYTYFFIRTVFTPYTPLLYNTRFLNYSLLLLFYFIVKYDNSCSITTIGSGNLNSHNEVEKIGAITFSEIFVIVLMLTGLVQAVWGLLQLYGITGSFHSGFKITGTFFNPAPYALYLATIFPIALGNLLQIRDLKNDKIKGNKTIELNNLGEPYLFLQVYQFFHSLFPSFLNYITPSSLIRKLTYYISILTAISIMQVLPATMNRASWLGAAAGSFVVINYRYNLFKKAKVLLHNTARKLFAFIIVISLIGLSIAGLYFLKKGSSDGRLLIWEVTIGKISEKPLFGHGVGRFETEYNNWQADYFKAHQGEMDGPKGMVAGNTKYCFNEFLEIASELGIIGLLLFLAGITSVFLGIKSENGDQKSLTPSFLHSSIFLLPSLISLLVCASISFPFYSLSTMIIFFLLLSLLSSYVNENLIIIKLLDSSIFRQFAQIIASLILIPVSVLLLFMTRQQYKAYYKWNEAVMIYQTGNYREACKSFSEVYVPFQHAGSYLQYYGKALNMNKEYRQGIEMLGRAAYYTSDEILYITLGDTYKALKRYSEAEEAYYHASFMVPHKLYPLYLLANLYDETGQKEKALMTAEYVLNKKIKVESTATEEIMHDMKELIRKLKN